MIVYQTLKYFLLDTCINTLFDKLQLNLRINLPPISIPIKGSYYKEIHGPGGQHFRDIFCKEIVKSCQLSFLYNDNTNSNEDVYLFSKNPSESGSDDNIVIIQVIIEESNLSNWLLIP